MVNLGSIVIPFTFSFHPKLRFDRQWKFAWPAILLVALFFLVWDAFFTSWGIWGFNDRYILGQRLLRMPLEEYAFFVCIPYACLFTYHCFSIFFEKLKNQSPGWVHWIIPIICLGFVILGWGGYYTMTTAILLGVLYLAHLLIWKSEYLNMFLFSYAILLIPFLITNGVLTGTGLEEEVVWYNNNHNVGIRIFTIPIEDIFYGMLMILGVVSIYEYLQVRARD
jgi:lycopene cyclase domain-containing protein